MRRLVSPRRPASPNSPPHPPSISVPVSRRAAVCHLIRLFSIQEESSALKCSQYYAFNSFPPGPVGAREEAAEERARQKTEGSLWSGGGERARERESEVSQDKSPLLNSRHDSLDNYLRYPTPPLPPLLPPSDTFKRAFIIQLSSDFTGCECVAAPTLWMLNDAPVSD